MQTMPMLWNPFKLSSMKCIDLEPPYPDFHGPFDDNNNLNPAEPSSNCHDDCVTVQVTALLLCTVCSPGTLEMAQRFRTKRPEQLNTPLNSSQLSPFTFFVFDCFASLLPLHPFTISSFMQSGNPDEVLS